VALNIEQARIALNTLYASEGEYDKWKAYPIIEEFINDVEKLLKRNSIRQEPALFRPFDEGD
jgi:hypothetical protein